MDSRKKNLLSLGLLVLVVLATVFLIVRHAAATSPVPVPLPPITPTPQVVVEEREVEKLVEKLVPVERKITVEELSAGLEDMGLLETEEYWFTMMTGASRTRKILGLELGFTESSFRASYDGEVIAGVDFARISLKKYDAAKTVVVTMPPAEILHVVVDPETFQLYSEKNGLFTRISAEDYNLSLVELEEAAREKALERGLLERAEEHARKLVENFLTGLLGADWRVTFE